MIFFILLLLICTHVTGDTRHATMTIYDIMTDDNTSPGELNEWNVNQRFVDEIKVVAVHEDDWEKYKYAEIDIKHGGVTGTFQVWDYCSDEDQDGSCSKNRGGNGFLLDVDFSAAKRVFGVSTMDIMWNVHWNYRGRINEESIARNYGIKRN